MLTSLLRRIAICVLFVFLCASLFAQFRPYTQVFSQNLKGGTAIFGNTTMRIMDATNTTPDATKMNETGNAVNGVGGLGYSQYGNDGNNMQAAMVDAAVPILTVFSTGSTWKYNNPNTDQGTAWRTLASPPAANWVAGTGSFGWGATQTVTIPLNTTTNYFLKTVNITDPALYTQFNVLLSYDDGAVVYVNGTEVYRTAMPTGTITYTTLASGGGAVNFNESFTIPASAFTAGNNVIAVEVHQHTVNNNDCYFDMSMTATPFVPGNATSADITLPSGTNTIKFARLYWGGRVDNVALALGSADTLQKIKLRKGSSGSYTSFTAAAASVNEYAVTLDDELYQSYVDVKDFIQANGSGTYTVANVPCTGGSILGGGHYAGWCIMIAYENLGMTYNSVRVYDGFSQVYDLGIPVTATVTLTGLNIPDNPLNLNEAIMSSMAWEGDANLGASLTSPQGDYLKINTIAASNAVNPVANFWNGSISKSGAFVSAKNPNYYNQMGIDIDELQVGQGYGIAPNASSVTFEFGTEADQYFPSVFAFSVKMKDPVITLVKTVTDANGNGTVEGNEVLTYTLSGSNPGPGTAFNTFVVDSLPTNVTYVAGSLKINSAPNCATPTVQTDAADADYAFKGVNGTRSYVKFFIGNGATSTAGGSMPINSSYNMQFKVKAGAIPGSITNTARITSNSQSGDTFNDDGTALISPAAAPVPVKMTTFTAALTGKNDGFLQWSTENELNNDHFEIERSEDGTHFVNRGIVAGNGTTATTHNYSFTDNINTTASLVYYRLRIIDLDGHESYSKIVPLRLKGAAGDDLSISPNPFEGSIKVTLTATNDAPAQFRIISFDGKEMINRNIQLQAGGNVVILNDLDHLSHGSYILEINTGTEKIIRKIVKN